jgi:fatty acid desaturase
MTEYAELRRLVTEAGLREGRPFYYGAHALLVLACFVLAGVVLARWPGGWVSLFVAGLLAFAYAQVAFLGHDASHHQMFARRSSEDVFCLACNLLIGFSYSWWTDKHTRHHRAPNQIGMDPDIDMPLLAFSPEQARATTGLTRTIVRYQAFVFPVMLLFEGIALRIASVVYLWRGKARFPVAESTLMAVHVIGYATFVFAVLPFWQAMFLIGVHQALFGLYLGAVFAPNHKGMPVIPRGSTIDSLQRQLLTSRNVRSHPITDFMFGGLNYQIEHHLFPRIPRSRLKDLQRIVRAFCSARGLPYHEVGLFESIRETFTHLSRVSASIQQEVGVVSRDDGDRAAARHPPLGQ